MPARQTRVTKDQAALNSQTRATRAAETLAAEAGAHADAAVLLVNVMERILLKLDEMLEKMPAPGPPP